MILSSATTFGGFVTTFGGVTYAYAIVAAAWGSRQLVGLHHGARR